MRPELLLGAATYPDDGTQLEALLGVLEGRVGEDRRARERSAGSGRCRSATRSRGWSRAARAARDRRSR